MDQSQISMDPSTGGYYMANYAMKPTLMTNIPMSAGAMTAISPTVVGTLPMMSQMNGQLMMPQIDTNMAAMTAGPGQALTVSPTSTMLQRSNTNATSVLQRSNTVNTMNTVIMAPNMPIPTVGHQPNSSVSSVVAQYGGGTLGGTIPPYYNQSELARQPSDAYDPTRRQVNRISELSSLSSGFGDGDIIMPGTFAQDGRGNLLPRPPPAATQPLRSSQNFVGRIAPSSAASSPRDTVYTEHSEDSPPRFRTVNSWVNQQAGRIRRAQHRVTGKKEYDGGGSEEGDIPPVPGLLAGQGMNGMPPEPQLNMMMPDGEIPRRVDMNIR